MTDTNIKNNRRVMLMEPPFYRLYHDQQSFVKYPLPLGYLSSAVCKNTNWSVQTYNSDFNPNEKNLHLIQDLKVMKKFIII